MISDIWISKDQTPTITVGVGLTSGCVLALWDHPEEKVRETCLMELARPKPLASANSMQVAYNYYAISVPKDTYVKQTCTNPLLDRTYLIPERTTKIIHVPGGCVSRTRESNVLTLRGQSIGKEIVMKWGEKDSSSIDIGFGDYSHLWGDAHTGESLKNLLLRKQSEKGKEKDETRAIDVVLFILIALGMAIVLIWAARKVYLSRQG